MYIKIKKLTPDAIIPERAHNDDAGLDLYAAEDCYLIPGKITKIRTGIAIQICREQNDFNTYAGFIWDRSSMGSKGFGKLAGVIDQGYTGEIMVLITNHNQPEISTLVKKGDKIAQIIFQKVETPSIREVQEFDNTSRGNNGFGSTGK